MYRFWHSVTRPLLDTIKPVSIVEVGTAQGQQTELLLSYAEKNSIKIHGIDPIEPEGLSRWRTTYGGLFTFHHGHGQDVLSQIDHYDVVLIDGDHNWYTVYHELKEIERHAEKTNHFPVIILHDIGWPYGRRDLYYNPERIPAEFRHEYGQGGLQRTHDGLIADGFNASMHHALKSGGARNGVLTAIEDFLKETNANLDLEILNGLHGLAVIMPRVLLESNPALQKFIASLQVTPEVAAHIGYIESERIDALMNAERHEVQQQNFLRYVANLEQYTHSAEEYVRTIEGNLNQQLQEAHIVAHEKMKQVEDMLNSKSWKVTLPLRALNHSKITLRMRKGVRQLKDAWKNIGVRLSGTPVVRNIGEKTVVPPRPQEAIDVIIFHRKNIEPLSETLASIAEQTIHPSSVIIVDMTEDSPDVLKKYVQKTPYEVRTIKLLDPTLLIEHTGIRSTASEYLLHAEAGTEFNANYIQEGIAALRRSPGAAIAYSNYYMRNVDGLQKTPAKIDMYEETSRKHLHASCIAQRDAFFHAWTMTGEGNSGKLLPAMLLYGWHAVKNESIASLVPTPVTNAISNTYTAVPLPRATLCLSLSGRQWAWPIMREFLEKQTYPHDQTHIILLDTSQDEAFGNVLQAWLTDCDYREYTYLRETVGLKGVADMPRELVARQISDACAVIYNRLARMCTTPLAFVLEEDVIPPLDAFVRLQKLIRPGVVSASGIYRHRQLPRLVAWDWNENGMPVPCPFMRTGIGSVGGNGFGCVVIDGPYFRNTVLRSGPPIGNFDHNFYNQAVYTEKRTAMIDWSIACRHYIDPDHWVVPH